MFVETNCRVSHLSETRHKLISSDKLIVSARDCTTHQLSCAKRLVFAAHTNSLRTTLTNAYSPVYRAARFRFDTTGLGVRVSAFRAQKRTYLNMAASIEAPQGRGEETQYVKCV